jgi:predicted nucleic acid-binding protein
VNDVPIVFDASVGVKWVLDEEFSDRAESLLAATIRRRQRIVGPPHFITEVCNVLHQRRRSRDDSLRISEEEADKALTRFLNFPIQIVAPSGLYQRAFAFAHHHSLPSVYDSLYVVLAQMLGAELWTSDSRLRRNLGDAAPWTRWIGDYEV